MSHFACALRQLSAADARLSYPLMMLRQLSLTLTFWQTILRVVDKESATRTVRLPGSGRLPAHHPFCDRDHVFHGGDRRATGTCRMFRYEYFADEAFRQILQLGSLCA